jgi:hypothetical protein
MNSGGTPVTRIDYYTIASAGTATTFGDLSLARYTLGAVCSPTRGVFAGGSGAYPDDYNVMDYITIASTGNATDFGDLNAQLYGVAGTSNCHGGLS